MEARDAAIGKWDFILKSLGVDEKFLVNKHGPCPVCGGIDRFRYDCKNGNGEFYCNGCGPGDGFELLMRLNKWDFKQAASEVRKFMGIAESDKEKAPARDPAIFLKRIAVEAKRISADDCASAYLKARGLKIIPPELFFHAGLNYFEDGKAIGKYPAMLAVIRDKNGVPLTYHVTYLEGDKKAPVSSPKKIMTPKGSIAGGAIRLFGEGEHIGIAEGIETAIAAHECYSFPVWAAVSAGGMESFDAPVGINHVTIFGDNDENYTGQRAAHALANRLAMKNKILVDVIINPTRGADFLDDWVKS